MAPAAENAKKRKAASSSTSSNKKAKLVEEGADAVKAILADSSNSDPEVLQLAQYARMLEEEIMALRPKEKSAGDVAKEADKLGASIRSGIVKQMAWKPSCKTGGAKWAYDGVCNDPVVFGRTLGLEGAPTFKMKKFSADDMSNALGDLFTSIRYGHLYQKGDITVRWPGDGTFKLSGTYGLP